MIRIILLLIVLAPASAGAQTFADRWRRIMIRAPDDGMASFFTDRRGAWGDRLDPGNTDPEQFYCAANGEPSGTRLRVCSDLACITCTVKDKGPSARLKRPVDLSPAGFRALGFRLGDGLGRVTIDRE